jgi:hypothetical protein
MEAWIAKSHELLEEVYMVSGVKKSVPDMIKAIDEHLRVGNRGGIYEKDLYRSLSHISVGLKYSVYHAPVAKEVIQ